MGEPLERHFANLDRLVGLERERDEARLGVEQAIGRAEDAERGRDVARECMRTVTSVLDELRAILGVPDLGDIVVHARRVVADRNSSRESLRLSVAAWDAAGMQGRDAVSVIREAQEQGARWALARAAQAAGDGVDALRAESICAEARKAEDKADHADSCPWHCCGPCNCAVRKAGEHG